jgi:hypothetical protein
VCASAEGPDPEQVQMEHGLLRPEITQNKMYLFILTK